MELAALEPPTSWVRCGEHHEPIFARRFEEDRGEELPAHLRHGHRHLGTFVRAEVDPSFSELDERPV